MKILLCPQCGFHLNAPMKIKCIVCGVEFESRHKTALYCSKRCWRSVPARRAKRAERARKKYRTNEVYRRKVIAESSKRVIDSYRKNPIIKVKMNLRSRIRKVLKRGKYRGDQDKVRAISTVGCTRDELRSHLESKFYSGMTWENYGVLWVVDHKVPLASFDLRTVAEQRKAAHYSNLQPLLKHHNADKAAKLNWVQP